MATATILKRYTPEEYLALERQATIKSEYKNGFITAMAGTSPKHNQDRAQLRQRDTGSVSGKALRSLHR